MLMVTSETWRTLKPARRSRSAARLTTRGSERNLATVLPVGPLSTANSDVPPTEIGDACAKIVRGSFRLVSRLLRVAIR
jgi:hypothetical protein